MAHKTFIKSYTRRDILKAGAASAIAVKRTISSGDAVDGAGEAFFWFFFIAAWAMGGLPLFTLIAYVCAV